MEFKKIQLNGFKSFADKTNFLIEDGLTGIVGPNGCGKSNIVDAIKWVLGERSAKSLRGEAMLDVIFAGSAGRKPLGAATVTLSFDNPADEKGQRTLPLDNDNVDVARRLYRDGRSEYLINGQKVRLKDVKDIFIDTGVGTAAYCIIEQGRVAKLVDASPLGNPRRVAVGLEQNRLAMLLAVLHRHGGLYMADQDVFVNVVGGVKVSETSADLALVLAIVSSFKDPLWYNSRLKDKSVSIPEAPVAA